MILTKIHGESYEKIQTADEEDPKENDLCQEVVALYCLGEIINSRTQMINRNTIVRIHLWEENGGGYFPQLHLNIEERNRSGGRRSRLPAEFSSVPIPAEKISVRHKQIDHLKGSLLLLVFHRIMITTCNQNTKNDHITIEEEYFQK
ncbi:hypothetical protein YC2023_066525 [Brassica napus]